MNKQVIDVLILGGGPSGLTAAIYTSRALLSTLLLAGNPPGGQLMWTSDVENFPGFPKSVTGPELINSMREQATKFGADIKDDNAVSIKGTHKEGFQVLTDSGQIYRGRAVIIATGASAKWLGIPSEQNLRGKGVSACAVCDGFFFKGKVVAVVGGGDSAMEESVYLTKFAEKVYVLVRKLEKDMRASKIMQERAKSNPKIKFMYNTEVKEILGDQFVTGLRIVNNDTGIEQVLDDVKGLFVSIGHKPNTDFLLSEDGSLVEIDKMGYISPKAGLGGVFVAGDVSDHVYRQAVTAAGFGCMAAIDCIKFLSEKV